ncbi:hypothetical protein JW935_27775 [candidate division KSB1 bacterium]|nr:hypothetical protein [candidate division KSB1 bacterium]
MTMSDSNKDKYREVGFFQGLGLFFSDFVGMQAMIGVVTFCSITFTGIGIVIILAIVSAIASGIFGLSSLGLSIFNLSDLDNIFSGEGFIVVYLFASFFVYLFWVYYIFIRPLAYQGSTPGMIDGLRERPGLIRTDGIEIGTEKNMGGIGLGRAILYYIVHIIVINIIVGFVTTFIIGVIKAPTFWAIIIYAVAFTLVGMLFSIKLQNKQNIASAIVGCQIVNY